MAEDESGSYTDGDDDEEDVPAGPPNADGAALAAPKAAPASLLPAGNPGDERRCERGSGSEKSQSPARPRSSGRGRSARRAGERAARSEAPAFIPPPPPPFRGKGKGKQKGRSPRRYCEHCWNPVGEHASSMEQHQYWNLECLVWQRYGDGSKMSWKEAQEGAQRQKERRERRIAEQAALRAAQPPPEPAVPPSKESKKPKEDQTEKKKRKKKKRATPSPSPKKHKKDKKDKKDGSGDSHEEPDKKKHRCELIPQEDGTYILKFVK